MVRVVVRKEVWDMSLFWWMCLCFVVGAGSVMLLVHLNSLPFPVVYSPVQDWLIGAGYVLLWVFIVGVLLIFIFLLLDEDTWERKKFVESVVDVSASDVKKLCKGGKK